MQREKTDPKLSDLLGLWHGDHLSMGWASPTLALEIARTAKPKDAQALGNAIYPPREGESSIPHDRQIIKCIKEGYRLWKEIGGEADSD